MRAHPTCRRVSLLASIAVGMTLLVGCAQSVGVSAADAAARDAAPALGAPEAPRTAATSAVAATVASADAITGAEGLAPGLYGLDRLTSSTSGNTVTIRAHRPCEQVMDELQAGQVGPGGDLHMTSGVAGGQDGRGRLLYVPKLFGQHLL